MSADQLDFGFDLAPTGGSPAAPRGAGRRLAPPKQPPGPTTTSGTWKPASLEPFHYTNALREVVRDVTATLEELRHIDLDRILLSIAQARRAGKNGVYASCVPLRFAGGASETRIGRQRYRMPPVTYQGREILYVVYFMLPRFHEEQDYREKLATVIHELFHISPHFDGDIRRFPGKNFAHGQSREAYHEVMRGLADRYLAESPRAQEHAFLRTPFAELMRHAGGVVGLSIPKPKAVPIGK